VDEDIADGQQLGAVLAQLRRLHAPRGVRLVSTQDLLLFCVLGSFSCLAVSKLEHQTFSPRPLACACPGQAVRAVRLLALLAVSALLFFTRVLCARRRYLDGPAVDVLL
jgi:hypothetical protein